MRVLFFLEPTVFRNEPGFLIDHFPWARLFRRMALEDGGAFALAANRSVCDVWSQADSVDDNECHPLDAYAGLESFGYSRAKYVAALYGAGDTDNALAKRLTAIVSRFGPDLVVMTAQNAFAAIAFKGLPTLYIEQPPLPRLGQPFRIGLDPCGHQTGSLLEVRADEIRNLPLNPAQRAAMQDLLEAVERGVASVNPSSGAVQSALREIKQEGPTALLVTQPPDWITFEGAYGAIDLEGLICAWHAALPEGWIGVPTYHTGYRLNGGMERELARSCPRLRFLPQDLSHNLTEPMLSVADGMITISSMSAVTGLLFGKRVVVAGRSPYNAWCSNDPAGLENVTPLSIDERISLFSFLCHRYSFTFADLMENISAFCGIIRGIFSDTDHTKWHLNLDEFSSERAQSLFILN